MKRPLNILVLSAVLGCGTAVFAASEVEPPTEEVRFDQRLNSQVPLDAVFRDETGKKVALKDLMNDRPVLLSLVYYECPMLCTLVLNGMVDAIKDVPYVIGDDYDIITISFNPEETHVMAERKKGAYLEMLGDESCAPGWRFLVGEKDQIDRVCESVGFSYKYVEETGEYAHRSGILILTPEGKVSRYFPGIEYPARDVRLGLVEASERKIGTLSDRLSLLCYHYDPAVGTYGFFIMNLIRFGCFLTVAVLFGGMAVMFRREHRSPMVAHS